MTSIWLFLLLLPSLATGEDATTPSAPTVEYANLTKNKDGDYMCGQSLITTKMSYCTPARRCDKVGIFYIVKDMDFQGSVKSFAICDKDGVVQLRIAKKPDVWKKLERIICVRKDGNSVIQAEFNGVIKKDDARKAKSDEHLRFNEGADLTDISIRCVSKDDSGMTRFDLYHYGHRSSENEEGVYKIGRIYLFYFFMCLILTLTFICGYYYYFLRYVNKRQTKSVNRRQGRHDELWLSIDRTDRFHNFDFEETWDAMPLLDQQIALEAALFIQKYHKEKFTPQLRQWIIDRGYPAGATEVILALAGLGDTEMPFYGPEERIKDKFTPELNKLEECASRLEARIVDTLNYANRLRRRKIVFTDHRLLDLHHLFIELSLTAIGSNSHPTV
ncbi:hypothetical protein PFISCL1PPCAC_1179, partial [Pristionchus fissidentatus]